MQWGVHTILADATMGISFGSLLTVGQGFSSIEIKINFIRPVFQGYLEAIETVIHEGKRTGMAEWSIYIKKYQSDDNPGKLADRATSNLFLL